MDNVKPTIISLEHHGKKHSSELPWDADMYELLDAFYGMCVSATFHPTTVLSAMSEWVNEKYNNERDD
jgi:hypothetical protein